MASRRFVEKAKLSNFTAKSTVPVACTPADGSTCTRLRAPEVVLMKLLAVTVQSPDAHSAKAGVRETNHAAPAPAPIRNARRTIFIAGRSVKSNFVRVRRMNAKLELDNSYFRAAGK